MLDEAAVLRPPPPAPSAPTSSDPPATSTTSTIVGAPLLPLALPPLFVQHQQFVEISPATFASTTSASDAASSSPAPPPDQPPAEPPGPARDKGRKWMSRAQADACQKAFHEWEGTVRDKGKEIAELSAQTGLTPAQIKKRFDYVRKQLKKGGLKEPEQPEGYRVDQQWTQLADDITGKRKARKGGQAGGGGGSSRSGGGSKSPAAVAATATSQGSGAGASSINGSSNNSQRKVSEGVSGGGGGEDGGGGGGNGDDLLLEGVAEGGASSSSSSSNIMHVNTASELMPTSGRVSVTSVASSLTGGGSTTGGSKTKYKFTHAQSLACVKKFDAWGGSVKGRQKEVQELATKLGLTVSQVKKRFDYLRQKKIKSHLDGAGTKKILEVAVEDVQSAITAKEGGAHRVEVQASLMEGGVTASAGLVSQIVRVLRKRPRVKVYALCRPRTGDFCYSNDEFEVLKKDIQAMKTVGVDGVVFGVLKDDCSIDSKRCKALVTAARPLSVTFSRAFDDVRDPAKALDDLMSMGIERVVTSGLARTAWEGQHTISALVARATGKMVIVASGGVDETNVLPLMQATGVHEVHVGSWAQEVFTCSYAPDRQPGKPLTCRRVSFQRVRAVRDIIAPGWEEELRRKRQGANKKQRVEGQQQQRQQPSQLPLPSPLPPPPPPTLDQQRLHHQPPPTEDDEEQEEEDDEEDDQGRDGEEDDEGDDDDDDDDDEREEDEYDDGGVGQFYNHHLHPQHQPHHHDHHGVATREEAPSTSSFDHHDAAHHHHHHHHHAVVCNEAGPSSSGGGIAMVPALPALDHLDDPGHDDDDDLQLSDDQRIDPTTWEALQHLPEDLDDDDSLPSI